MKYLYANFRAERATKKLIAEGEYEPLKTPDRILDLGAHKGFATEHFARQYPNAIIHAYEPNPKNYKALLKRTKSYPNVTCFNEAIGPEGVVAFNVSKLSLASSLSPLSAVYGKTEQIQVNSVSLKTALERIGGPAFVKMDIEGAEYEALKDLPTDVTEIVGELHPEKAVPSPIDFKHLSVIKMPKGKGIFHAV